MSRLAEALKLAAAEGKASEPTVSPGGDEAVFVAAWNLKAPVAVATGVANEFPVPAATASGTPGIRLESLLAMGWPHPVPSNFADKLVIMRGCDAGVVRAFHDLADALRQRQHAARSRSVVVTSAAAGEGKTLTAVNLALTLSESDGLRVLLVDAHLAQPMVHEVFGVSAGSGLRSSLGSPHAELPIVGVTSRLFVLPAGRQDHALPATIDPNRMREIIDRASASFDWVVIDSPPVLAWPDAAALSSPATDVLLVVPGRKTSRDAVQRAAQALAPGRLAGVVINRGQLGRK